MKARRAAGVEDCGRRRAAAAVAMIVVLLIVDLVIVGLAVGLSRDHELTVRRMETLEALYGAESGMNMSIREMMNNADEDLDGGIGTISDDSNDATDPTIGSARFVVTLTSPAAGQTLLTSMARCGEARRKMEALLQD